MCYSRFLPHSPPINACERGKAVPYHIHHLHRRGRRRDAHADTGLHFLPPPAVRAGHLHICCPATRRGGIWSRPKLGPPHQIISALLRHIRNFSPLIGRQLVECYSYFDIHDVLQWLKGFPRPPLDMNYNYRRDLGNAHTFYLGEKYLEHPAAEVSREKPFRSVLGGRQTNLQAAQYPYCDGGDAHGKGQCAAPTQYAAAARQPRGRGRSAARLSGGLRRTRGWSAKARTAPRNPKTRDLEASGVASLGGGVIREAQTRRKRR
ncbi:hypothetical protein DFH09DRAFT_1100611 [Mycena vulgaris]|nr:hypothetical protein DFH09DRAFT_1100611 [Mycena vulgaris]